MHGFAQLVNRWQPAVGLLVAMWSCASAACAGKEISIQGDNVVIATTGGEPVTKPLITHDQKIDGRVVKYYTLSADEVGTGTTIDSRITAESVKGVLILKDMKSMCKEMYFMDNNNTQVKDTAQYLYTAVLIEAEVEVLDDMTIKLVSGSMYVTATFKRDCRVAGENVPGEAVTPWWYPLTVTKTTSAGVAGTEMIAWSSTLLSSMTRVYLVDSTSPTHTVWARPENVPLTSTGGQTDFKTDKQYGWSQSESGPVIQKELPAPSSTITDDYDPDQKAREIKDDALAIVEGLGLRKP